MVNMSNNLKDETIKIRAKGGSFEARKTIDLSKIYGFEVTKRISKTAKTEEKAIKLLAEKEREEILKAVEVVKTQKITNKLEYDTLEKKINNIGNDYTFKAFVNKMILEKKIQAEMDFDKRRRKISPKTVTAYIGTANKQVIPVWGDLDIRTITTEQLQKHFDELDYSAKYLKDIRLILKMAFKTAIDLGVITKNPAVDVYIGCRKSNIGVEIEHLEKDRQAVWLDTIEKDARAWVYLFESILLSGARPEEACAYQWKTIDMERNMIYIRKAFKDTIVYDNDLKRKCHKRVLDDVKTAQSVRDIPLNPRLKKMLLKIKMDRIVEYKKVGKELSDDEFIFLNKKGEPFVSENLTKKMPTFIKKYGLEHMTVYGLRHSFATLCASEGVPPEVLHILMRTSENLIQQENIIYI